MTKTKKHHVGMLIEKNSFIDDGNGEVTFPKGLIVTDNSLQRNGTKYDIDTLDLSEYKGQVTADHRDRLSNIIARVDGIEKTGNKVIVKKLIYAVNENPLARLAYNLLIKGFSKDFSIETYGPSPYNDIYMNAKLIGLSQVVIGNNRCAALNSIAKNSLEQSKQDGLDVSEIEEIIDSIEDEEKIEAGKIEAEKAKIMAEEEAKRIEEEAIKKIEEEAIKETEEKAKLEAIEAEKFSEEKEKQNNNKKEKNEMTFVTIKNSRDFPVAVFYKNAAGDSVEAVIEADKSVDISEDQKEVVEAQITSAVKPVDESIQKNAIADAVKNAMSSYEDQIKALKDAFNASAKAPEFSKTGETGKVENEFSKLSYKERHAKQINAAWEYLKLGRIEASRVLNSINEINVEALKADGKIENSMTIADFGNFVISPELLTEIQGFRSDYTALINVTDWRETMSAQFAYIKRVGDISMTSVTTCDDGANGNLKPISEYTATPVVATLEELAAVTPVCNAATRFLAVDLLGDIARGYRNDYDRKRAQLIIARLEQAIESNGNSVIYDVNPAVDSLTDFVSVWSKVAQSTPNGTYIFNTDTLAEIQKRAVEAGVNGPLSNIFITGNIPTIFGRPFIVVPNDIMPSLNTAGTKTIVVDGVSVIINHAVFYFDTTNFTGRTSGGLQYDLSTEASYEVNSVVKSAYQRNELVLRGSFFRGGAILDDSRVAGLLANGVS